MIFKKIALFAAAAMMLAACSDNGDELTVTVTFDSMASQMNADGYWNATYTNVSGFSVDGFHFSHLGYSDWGGYYFGFEPSMSSDNKEYPADQLLAHQWASITGTNAAGKNAPYLLACWDTQDTLDPSSSRTLSLVITAADGLPFEPKSVKITNAAYSYYAMVNGSNFSKKFTASDWLTLKIHGLSANAPTGVVEVQLAPNGTPINYWKAVDLKGLRTVDALVFTMEGSDSGEWGLNTPAYFCLDELKIKETE